MAAQEWNRPTEAQGRNRPEEEGEGYLQQTVLLNFANLSWPHVSVATLRKVT